MATAKSLTVCVAALAGAVALAHQTSHHHGNTGSKRSQWAWSLLSKTMEWDRFTPCKGVIEQRSMDNDLMQLWAEQSSDGKLKLAVLSPLSEQGIVSIDDGRQWVTYHPDENRVYVQASARQSAPSVPFRLNLAKENYDLSYDGEHCSVAGRKAYAVLAIPKHPQMPSRRYCIDQKKPFLLRMEVVTPKGEHKVMLNTKRIEFLDEVDEDDFQLQESDPATVKTLGSPSRSPLGANAKRLVGFKPAIPKALPFGFKVSQPELSGSGGNKFVAVRITDGLVNATVYQWNCKHGSKQELGGDCSKDRHARNIGMRMVGEVPEVVMVKLLDSFIREALKQIDPYLLLSNFSETSNPDNTLNGQQKSYEVDLNIGQSLADVAPGDYIFALVEIDE